MVTGTVERRMILWMLRERQALLGDQFTVSRAIASIEACEHNPLSHITDILKAFARKERPSDELLVTVLALVAEVLKP